MTTQKPLGVGILGAGPVTQAIHLPTLSRLSDLFTVTTIMDVNPDVAASVAARVNARAVTSMEDLLADPDVDVVAICSPPQFHAAQVIAAMDAGKKAVLCEKPYATTQAEAEQIAAASERTGVPVLVGAMHIFDPGWQAVAEEVQRLAASTHTVRSRIIIPFNDRFEDAATEVVARPDLQLGGGEMTAEAVAAMFNTAILGLAVHDLPLVRTFLPDAAEITIHTAKLLQPFGYVIEGSAGDRNMHLVACVEGHWETYWELEAITPDEVLTVRFTPSYVHAGSAVATLRRADGPTTTWGPYEANGYENEWRSLHSVVAGDLSAAPAQKTLIEDLTFTLAVAEQSATRAAEEFAS
jgi:myo-inositol 2-dehydrogenase / D-chiro-inositol 1-dehydrogenase